MQEAWVSSLVEEDPECCVAVSPAKEREKEKEKEKERGRRQPGDAEGKRLGETSLRASGGRGSGMSKWINGGLGQAREQSGEPEV